MPNRNLCGCGRDHGTLAGALVFWGGLIGLVVLAFVLGG